jgi:hypothetical protein
MSSDIEYAGSAAAPKITPTSECIPPITKPLYPKWSDRECRTCNVVATDKVEIFTWIPDPVFEEFKHTATFTYTVVTVINTVMDTTTWRVIIPDEVIAAGFAPPTDTNSEFKRTSVTTFSHTGNQHTTTM